MTKSRILYAGIIIAAFIFSQALYDSVSLFTLVCVLILPFISALLLLIGKSTIQIQCKLIHKEVNRFQETKLYVEVRCGAPFLSPVLRLNCLLPDDLGDRTCKRRLHISFSPMTKTVIEMPFTYNYRGTYDVGVDSIEICDFLRLIKVKKRVNTNWKLRVMPRFLPVDLNMQQKIYLEDGASTDMVNAGGYAADLLGVREFNDSDSLRYVHWNLSAIKDELMVKTFAANRQKQVYILLDLTDDTPEELQSRRRGDALVETALSLARNFMSHIGSVCLMFSGGGLQTHQIDTPLSLSAAYTAVALCPLQPPKALDKMLSQISNVQDLCYVTGVLTEEKIRRIEIMLQYVQCPIRILALEKDDSVEPSKYKSKGITIEILHLEDIEKGRIV